jgi:prophage tail gpP-like protein
MSGDVTLKLGNQVYSGWQELKITRGIEQLAGSFELGCADRWAIEGKPLPLLAGKLAQVAIAGTSVIKGFIDETETDYDKKKHTLTIRGRDFTGDLVDCAATVDGQSWVKRKLIDIATDLCAPFGISVSVAGSPDDQFNLQAINLCETAYEVLVRSAALRGYFPVSDGNGGLLLTQAGTSRCTTKLELGKNIIAANGIDSHRYRFYEYQVIGQDAEAIAEGVGPTPAVQQLLMKSHDPNIRQQRITRVNATDAINDAEAQIFADWCKVNRVAQGRRVDITVPGWLDTTKPWMPNTLVYVDDRFSRLQGWYLIAQVESRLDKQHGKVSVITVTLPGAFTPAPSFELDNP